MDQVTPPWRTFPAAPTEPEQASAPRASSVVLLLAIAGGIGLAAIVAVLVIVVLLWSTAPPPTLEVGLGEPLRDAQELAMDAPLAGGAPMAATAGLVVDVAGAVVHPGLHRLSPGARVGDALEAAGGFAPRADLEEAGRVLNLAEPLVDGAKVLVPELGSGGRSRPSDTDDRIDVNSAGQAELESLPGIGPVTAQKILDARSERRFGSVRELRDRGLVGESVFRDIEALVRVG